jgi:hypothetical protein
MQGCRGLVWVGLAALSLTAVHAQIIEFESGSLKYQTLTRNGLTIMVAQLPGSVRDYSVIQVAVANGSRVPYVIRPEDFIFYRDDGPGIGALPARTVVNAFFSRASRGDVAKLVTTYEMGIFGNTQYKATNGYEQRRQSYLADFSSPRLTAAAAASAIVFVQTKLAPGQSTDGAVFYQSSGKPLGTGTIRVRAAGATFEFPMVLSN